MLERSAVHVINGKHCVRKKDLIPPERFGERFDQLLRTGYPWLNLSCVGIHDGRLIVAIEVPNTVAKPVPITSVNFSGPSEAVIRNGWRVDPELTIDDGSE
jgi:hypothetical protein